MPMVYPQYGPGMGTAALDALRGFNITSPQHGQGPQPHRLAENESWGSPNPIPATPPADQSMSEIVMNSLKMAGPQAPPPKWGGRFQQPGTEYPKLES